ncbi:hypothetical protein [Streptomyces sp. NPDC001537]
MRQVRRTGLGTAVILRAVDLVCVAMGRIRPPCLADAVMQTGRLLAPVRPTRVTTGGRMNRTATEAA